MYSRQFLLVATLFVIVLGGLGVAFAFQQKGDTKKPAKETKEAPVILGRLTPDKAAVEEAAISKRLEAFSAAYNKGDLDGVMAPWTEDAEFISESGKTYRGKEQIRVLMKRALANAKGSKQSIRMTALRFIKADVAIEDGEVTVENKEGPETGRYEAVWVKIDGKWYMNRVRDVLEPAAEDVPAAVGKLSPLGWMIGEWVDKDGKGDVTVNCKWGPGKTFILQEFTVKRQKNADLIVTQRIGYDAAEGKIRSWIFDSDGGFADCYWEREGNSWVTDSKGTFPDGRRSVANNRWRFVDENSMVWSSKDREVDEQPLPDIEVTFVRGGVKGR